MSKTIYTKIRDYHFEYFEYDMKCAVIGLVRGYSYVDEYDKLIERNNKLYQNFIKKFNYDVIIVHEGNINKEHQEYIQSKSYSKLIFLDISNLWNKLQGNGYNRMCRFWSKEIYNYVNEYQYIMRLDDDGIIDAPIDYDIFQFMRKHNYSYAYIRRKYDPHEPTKRTFVPFCLKYFKRDLKPMENFYNNFFITKTDFWKNKDVQTFLNEVINQNGIVKYRWGDSNIQAVCVKNWMAKDEIFCIEDIKYRHGSHNYNNFDDVKHEW